MINTRAGLIWLNTEKTIVVRPIRCQGQTFNLTLHNIPESGDTITSGEKKESDWYIGIGHVKVLPILLL